MGVAVPLFPSAICLHGMHRDNIPW